MARSNAARKISSKDQQIKSSPASSIATSLDRLLHDRMRLGIVSALDIARAVAQRKLDTPRYVYSARRFETR